MGIAIVSACVMVTLLLLVARYQRAQLLPAVLFSAAWIAVFSVLALQGVLARMDMRPPPFVLMLVSVLIVSVLVGRSRLFASVPLWLLVAVQSFRLPLEIVMHELARSGIMPNEMSFSGYNFDIVSGATALVAAFLIRRTGSLRLALAWNVLGSVLLLVIVSIAVLASPLIRAFGEGEHVNRFVAQFPYVFLPTICVAAALALHVAIFRRVLSGERR